MVPAIAAARSAIDSFFVALLPSASINTILSLATLTVAAPTSSKSTLKADPPPPTIPVPATEDANCTSVIPAFATLTPLAPKSNVEPDI